MANKKGISNFMKITLALFVMLILGLFVGSFAYQATEKSKLDVCAKSIVLADARIKESAIKKIVLPDIELQCERLQFHVRSKEYENDGKINYGKLNNDIAEKMLDFWAITGNGAADPFNESIGGACLIGYEITFDKKFIELQQKTKDNYTGLETWLTEHSPSSLITDSYFSHLNAYIPYEQIDTTKKYAAIWRHEDGKKSSMLIIPEEEMLDDILFAENMVKACEHLYN